MMSSDLPIGGQGWLCLLSLLTLAFTTKRSALVTHWEPGSLLQQLWAMKGIFWPPVISFPSFFRVRDGVTGLHAIPILQYILILAYPPNRSINNNTSKNVTLKGGGVYTLQHQALHRREVICFYQEHKACGQHSISVRDAQTSRRSKCHVYKIPMALASPRR